MAGKVLMTLFLVAIGIAGSGFYIRAREDDAQKVTHISSLSQIDGVSATYCWYAIGTYGSGTSGYMYIYQNKLRINVVGLNIPNFSGGMHAVIGIDGTRQIDPASLQAAGTGVNAASVLNALITQAPWQCSPWWFPSGSMFDIPDAITF